MHSQSLYLVFVFLLASVVIVPLAQKLKLGSVIGYLAAGFLLGPQMLKVVSDVESVFDFSELGIVFLLFLIGLEMKPNRLWTMRRHLFVTGGLQLILTSVLFFIFLSMFEMDLMVRIVLSVVFSFSSTAFAIQILSESGQLNTSLGRSAFSILLFQDLAAIPLLALIPVLFFQTKGHSVSPWISILGLILTVIAGKLLLRPVLQWIALARNRDLFSAFSLFLVIGVSLLMAQIGLSSALGAFIAGVLLSDSEYRHELESNIEPFKGLLLGLFFLAVGMSFNLQFVMDQPLIVLGLWAAYSGIKLLGNSLAGHLSGLGFETSVGLASVLVQGSEFGFLVVKMLQPTGLISAALFDAAISVIFLSMLTTPLFWEWGQWMQKRKCNTHHNKRQFDEISEKNAVIIAGYGRVGQIVGRFLKLSGFDVTILEHDPEQVDVVRKFGSKVFYGDAGQLPLLVSAGIEKAKMFVIAIDDVESSVKAAELVRSHFPHVQILARARNRAHTHQLMELGVTWIERETFWSSLRMAEQSLRILGWAEDRIQRWSQNFVSHDHRLLEAQFKVYKDQEQLISVSKQFSDELQQLLNQEQELQKSGLSQQVN